MSIKAFKTELDPNNVEATKLAQHAGTARFAYNWSLNLLQENYNNKKQEERNHLEQRKLNNLPKYTDKELKEYRKELNKKYPHLSAIDLHKKLIQLKETEFPWMKEISKWSPQNALRNIEKAYKKFFTWMKSRKGKKVGLPNKKKKDKKQSFTLDAPIHVTETTIKLPKIGKVKLKEHGYIPEGSPKSATVSFKANKWFVSVQYEVEIEKIETIDKTIGVDLGIKTLATCSDGTIVENSKKLKNKEKTLKRLQRKLSKQTKGSASRKKTKLKIQKLHYKISCDRKDNLNKLTSLLAKTKLERNIVIEDLNVGGMMKNHKLAKSIANVGMYEFRRELTYKCEWYGKNVLLANRFYGSSKTCSCCGYYNRDLKLSDRIFICPNCGSRIERDFNASKNLEVTNEVVWLVKSCSTARYAVIDAGGDKKFIDSLEGGLRCLSTNPELNIESTSN